MTELVALVFQGIEGLILDLPPGAGAAHKPVNVILGNVQVGLFNGAL